MGRIRTIKPDFFLDEEVAKLASTERLAFIGLLCLADREGRLEDKPNQIRVQLFPYEQNIDMNAILSSLCHKPFIQRYEVEGHKYIQIIGFVEHQRINSREAQSVIPGPGGVSHACTCMHMQDEGEGKGREGKGREGVRAPQKSAASIYSDIFIKKAKEVEAKGFNIYQLVGRFYKDSRLSEKLPEDVLIAVMDKILSNGQVKDHWPYFLKVLNEKSRDYFARTNQEMSEKLKKEPSRIGDVLARMAADVQ
jgi:hypothetical protein